MRRHRPSEPVSYRGWHLTVYVFYFIFYFLLAPIAELQALGSCHFKYSFVKLLLGWFAIACPSVERVKLETNPLK